MKVSIDLPEDLLTAARKRAEELHCSLDRLLESELRAQLLQPVLEARARNEINWVTVDGGLPPGLDLASRQAMHEWLLQHKSE